MKLPQFCYQKAFWLLFSMVIISTASGIVAINNQISALDGRVRVTEQTIANNDVPALKTSLEKRLDKIDINLEIIKTQSETIKAQNQLQNKLFCIAHPNLCP